MAHVILQPSGSSSARQHYADTIENPVNFDDRASLFKPGQESHLREIFPDGSAPLWGVTPGKNRINVSKFERAHIGDLVVFAAEGRIFSCGTVAAIFENRELAESLWGLDPNGMTWEYMYALDEIRPLNIPYAEFNHVVGYKENNIIQGFTVLDETRSDTFLSTFDLWSRAHERDTSDQEIEDALLVLDGPLDREVKGKARAEQARARSIHLGKRRSGECRLCARDIPREFLVAAHKKKRAACSDAEKRDIKNVTMLCCIFGCDALYERGFISVAEDGSILTSKRAYTSPVVKEYATNILVDSLEIDSAEARYFEWHRETFFASIRRTGRS